MSILKIMKKPRWKVREEIRQSTGFRAWLAEIVLLLRSPTHSLFWMAVFGMLAWGLALVAPGIADPVLRFEGIRYIDEVYVKPLPLAALFANFFAFVVSPYPRLALFGLGSFGLWCFWTYPATRYFFHGQHLLGAMSGLFALVTLWSFYLWAREYIPRLCDSITRS